MKTFKFKQFYKIYVDGCYWFNFGAERIDGCDFREIFLLTFVGQSIIEYPRLPIDTLSNILNRTYLDYNDNFRYDTIERIKLYDKEEYYR